MINFTPLGFFPPIIFLLCKVQVKACAVTAGVTKVENFARAAKPSTKDLAKMLASPNSYHTKARDAAGEMLNKTRTMLQEWFKPWNQELAQLMKDKGYLWGYAGDTR
jgi:hypothetical protein